MKSFIFATLLVSATFTQASDIIISAKIKEPMRSTIERDLSVLEKLNFKETSFKAMEIFGIIKLNSTNALEWLSERVKYIVEENAAFTKRGRLNNSVYKIQKNVTYPNEEYLGSLNKKNANARIEKSSVMMSNLGTSLYLAGKSSKTLYGLKISTGSFKKPIKLVIDSPRVGIVEVGESSLDKKYQINKKNDIAFSNSIFRLGFLFHEARHSDGNANSLAFTHSICPKGHDYEGEYACDESLNGSYAVEAIITSEMINACDDNCSEREKEVLTLKSLDSLTRVIVETSDGTPSVNLDTTPEIL